MFLSHREQRPGEIFIGYHEERTYRLLTYRLSRKGSCVYNDEGIEIPQQHISEAYRRFPVFVPQAEFMEVQHILTSKQIREKNKFHVLSFR